MNNKAPWHARLARTLAIILPLFLVGSALGTKYGLWGWQLGLSAFGLGGLILIGLTALIAIVSIVLILRSGSKLGIGSAGFALAVPALFLTMFAPTLGGAGDHPIHDVSPDTANPPMFSAETLAERAQSGANAINPYDVALGKTEQFASMEPPVSEMTTAQVVAEKYPELAPLGLSETPVDAAVNALQLAMADMGFSGIRYDAESRTVEGLAETFWFGFKDDVVARVSETQIDFRSVSRVGQSDVGANAKRIMELRARTAERLGL